MTRPILAQLQALSRVAGITPAGKVGLPWLFAYQGGAAAPHWSIRSPGSAPDLDNYFVFVPRSWLLKRRSNGNRNGAPNA